MELKFGCRLKDKQDGKEYLFVDWHFNTCPTVIPVEAIGKTPFEEDCMWQDTIFSMGSVSDEEVQHPFGLASTYEILGASPQLHHVLKALRLSNIPFTLEIIEIFRTTVIEKLLKLWNLDQDLSHQSPEVIEFLYSIICKNER